MTRDPRYMYAWEFKKHAASAESSGWEVTGDIPADPDRPQPLPLVALRKKRRVYPDGTPVIWQPE